MTILKSKNIRKSLSSFMMFFFLLIGAMSGAQAQQVVLNPGFISGQIQLGSEVIKKITLRATFDTFTASIINGFQPPNTTAVSYTLTVEVPPGTSPTYTVSPQVTFQGGTTINFPPQSVVVQEAQTSTVDFLVPNPGFVQGTITVVDEFGNPLPGKLVTAQVNAINLASGRPPASFHGGVPPNGVYQFPVIPRFTYLISVGSATLVGGIITGGNFGRVTVAPGQTVTKNIQVTKPSVGSVAGNLNIIDPANLPKTTRINIDNEQAVLTQNGPYQIDGIRASGSLRNVSASTNFGALGRFNQLLRHPPANFTPPLSTPSPRINVVAGSVTSLDLSSTLASITGKVGILGSASMADVTRIGVSSFGVLGTNTEGGRGTARVNLSTGDYELIVTEGSWNPIGASLSFLNNDPDPSVFLDASYGTFGIVTPSKPAVSVSANNPAIRDLNFPMGRVSVNFSVADGSVLSNPRLFTTNSGRCVEINATGQQTSLYSINANSHQTNVPIGTVNFVGTKATCTLKADALVGGTRTIFGQLVVDVVPGATQVIDIGGPMLTVQFPEPGFITSNPNITVTGLVTDDVAVAGVTVNGVAATLVSTNNLSDPAEMSFSATIPLVRRPNEIVTVATDTASPAKTGSDTRTVFRDEALPALNWTPADGTLVSSTGAITSIQVSGTADDDAGIQSITVNGNVVAVQSTNNVAKPNEVSFNVTVNGHDGDNFIEVVAMDISNRTTAQTHKVIVTVNQPPVANAGADQIVEQQSPAGSSVILSGGLSTDPDNDPLNFTWTGPFGIATGATPTVVIPAGTSIVTLIVNDGTVDSAPDTVSITVRDTTAPVITAPATANAEATGVQTTVAIGTAMATDAVGPVTITSNAPLTFPLGTTTVTWTATDGAGNSSSATQTVTVSDTTPPTLAIPIDVTVEATGPLTTVVIGSATATDLVDGTLIPASDAPASYPVGTTVVTWTVTDAAGNTATGTQNVTVADTTPPTITARLIPVGDGDEEGDSDEGRFIVSFSATDIADPAPSVSAVLVIPGSTPISVSNGQLIEFEFEDEKTEIEIETKNGVSVLEIEAPGLTLRVTATDASGNSSFVDVQPTGLTADNDDDSNPLEKDDD